jgi:hypothetical protein
MVVVMKVWVWKKGLSIQTMDTKRKHVLNGDLNFAKTIG